VQQFAAALAGTAVLVPFARMPSKLGIRRGMSATYRLPIESPETGSQLPPQKKCPIPWQQQSTCQICPLNNGNVEVLNLDNNRFNSSRVPF